MDARWTAVADEAAERWPGVTRADAAFFARVEGRPFERCPVPVELWLVDACLRNDATALQIFERDFLAPLPPTLRRFRLDVAAVDELLQTLRTHLLLPGADRPARLATFEGSAPLAAWLRAVLVRLALDVTRATTAGAREGDEVLAELSCSGTALDVAVMRAEHAPALREAFVSGFRALSPRERNVVRLQVLDGLSLEQIGALYGVNKSSVSRWLAEVHQQLRRAVLRALGERLALPPPELESLVDLMRSQLELASALRTGSVS